MNPEERKRIQKAWMKLLANVSNVDAVIDGLYAEEVITQQLKEKICAGETESEKLRKLLDILPRRGGNAFNKFYDVLVEVGEDTAADCLCPERAEERKRKASHDPGNHPAHGPAVKKGSFDQNDEENELPKKWPDPESHDPFRIDLVKVPSSAQNMRDKFNKAVRIGSDSGFYPMHRPKRGIFLLLNNMLFKRAREEKVKLEDRHGTEKDQMALDMLFKQLGFEVVIESNLTAQEMLKAIQRQALVDHTSYDCFACAVLTHGMKGSIYGVDGDLLGVDKFKDAVDGNHCMTLVGKPKLFFIQACQGEAYDKGSGIATGSGEAGPNPKVLEETEKDLDLVLEKMTNVTIRGDAKTDASAEGTTPSKADVFVAMATVEDFVSWRTTGWGTFFVQAMVYVFSRLSHKYELNQLMLRVNRLVSRAETKKKFKQISVFRSALTSELYLFPGLVSTIMESHSEVDLSSHSKSNNAVQSEKSPIAQPADCDGPSVMVP